MLRRTIMAARTAWWALRNWERLSMLHFAMLRDAQVYGERPLSGDARYWVGRSHAAAYYASEFSGAPFQRPNEEAAK